MYVICTYMYMLRVLIYHKHVCSCKFDCNIRRDDRTNVRYNIVYPYKKSVYIYETRFPEKYNRNYKSICIYFIIIRAVSNYTYMYVFPQYYN